MKYSKSGFILTAVIIVIITANLPASGETNEEKAERIEKLIKEACPLLLSGLGPDEHTEKIDRAKKELVSLGDEIIPYLIKHLEKGDIQVESILSEIIPKGIPELVELLKTHKDASVRARTAKTMGFLRYGKKIDIVDPIVLPALKEAVFNDKDGKVRKSAFCSIAKKSKVERDILLYALKDDEHIVRTAAVGVVRNSLEKDEAIDILRGLNEDKSVEVREEAGIELAAFKDDAAISVLIEALNSENEYTRRRAEYLLENWFHLRFYGSAPGQTTNRAEIPKMWGKWWQENKDTIDKQYTIIIRPEDTFSRLAVMHYKHEDYKMSLEKRRKIIMDANPGIEPTKMIDGHKLIIPRLEKPHL